MLGKAHVVVTYSSRFGHGIAELLNRGIEQDGGGEDKSMYSARRSLPIENAEKIMAANGSYYG